MSRSKERKKVFSGFFACISAKLAASHLSQSVSPIHTHISTHLQKYSTDCLIRRRSGEGAWLSKEKVVECCDSREQERWTGIYHGHGLESWDDLWAIWNRARCENKDLRRLFIFYVVGEEKALWFVWVLFFRMIFLSCGQFESCTSTKKESKNLPIYLRRTLNAFHVDSNYIIHQIVYKIEIFRNWLSYGME